MRTRDELLYTDFHSITPSEWEYLERSGVCNGFGPANNKIINCLLSRISPAFDSVIAFEHDRLYTRGGNDDDRRRADINFFSAMLADCIRFNGKLLNKYIILSFAYYFAVRIFGRYYFNYK